MNGSLKLVHNQLTLRLFPRRRWWCPLMLSHYGVSTILFQKENEVVGASWACCSKIVTRSAENLDLGFLRNARLVRGRNRKTRLVHGFISIPMPLQRPRRLDASKTRKEPSHYKDKTRFEKATPSQKREHPSSSSLFYSEFVSATNRLTNILSYSRHHSHAHNEVLACHFSHKIETLITGTHEKPGWGTLPSCVAMTAAAASTLGHDESHKNDGNCNSHATHNGPKGWIIQIAMALLFLGFGIPKDGTASPNVKHDETRK